VASGHSFAWHWADLPVVGCSGGDLIPSFAPPPWMLLMGAGELTAPTQGCSSSTSPNLAETVGKMHERLDTLPPRLARQVRRLSGFAPLFSSLLWWYLWLLPVVGQTALLTPFALDMLVGELTHHGQTSVTSHLLDTTSFMNVVIQESIPPSLSSQAGS
jgi:hypothetical protein